MTTHPWNRAGRRVGAVNDQLRFSFTILLKVFFSTFSLSAAKAAAENAGYSRAVIAAALIAVGLVGIFGIEFGFSGCALPVQPYLQHPQGAAPTAPSELHQANWGSSDVRATTHTDAHANPDPGGAAALPSTDSAQAVALQPAATPNITSYPAEQNLGTGSTQFLPNTSPGLLTTGPLTPPFPSIPTPGLPWGLNPFPATNQGPLILDTPADPARGINVLESTTRNGVARNNPGEWRTTRDLWDQVGYGGILSELNRQRIAQGLVPKVDQNWVDYFPGDASNMGQNISIHHINGDWLTVPLPKSRHRDAHMPGGFRYNPGGPGMTG